MMDVITQGLLFVAGLFVCVSLGMLVTMQARAMEAQAKMLGLIAELALTVATLKHMDVTRATESVARVEEELEKLRRH